MHIFNIHPESAQQITFGKPPSVGQKFSVTYERVEFIIHNTGEVFNTFSKVDPSKLFFYIKDVWKLKTTVTLNTYLVFHNSIEDQRNFLAPKIDSFEAESVSHVEHLTALKHPSNLILLIRRSESIPQALDEYYSEKTQAQGQTATKAERVKQNRRVQHKPQR